MSSPAEAISIPFATLAPRDRYKLLCGAVVPRPIALVTSRDAAGRVNAAPFSFFNVFAEDPALVVLGLQHREGAPKDTTRNIREAGAFVVNLVDEPLAEAMNVCGIDFPPDVSEIEAAGLRLAASASIDVPRLAHAPFSLECRRHLILSFGPDRDLLIGEVVHLHARSGLLDPATLYVDPAAYRPIGRLFGSSYCRQGDVFEMPRMTPAQWEASRRGAPGD